MPCISEMYTSEECFQEDGAPLHHHEHCETSRMYRKFEASS
jgi:hypothetical protein